MTDGLTFNTLRQANIKRLPQFKNAKGQPAHSTEDGSDWSPAQWLQAVTGELGEYANLRKKYERGDMDYGEFMNAAADELADVVTYLDILAKQLGIDLGRAVINKFNFISKRVGSSVFIESDGSDFYLKPTTMNQVHQHSEGEEFQPTAYRQIKAYPGRPLSKSDIIWKLVAKAEFGYGSYLDRFSRGKYIDDEGRNISSSSIEYCRDLFSQWPEFYEPYPSKSLPVKEGQPDIGYELGWKDGKAAGLSERQRLESEIAQLKSAQGEEKSYTVKDLVDLVCDNDGTIIATGFLDRDYVLNEYPDCIISGKHYDLVDEGSSYHIVEHKKQSKSQLKSAQVSEIEFKHLAGITALGEMGDNALHACVKIVLDAYFKLHPELLEEPLTPPKEEVEPIIKHLKSLADRIEALANRYPSPKEQISPQPDQSNTEIDRSLRLDFSESNMDQQQWQESDRQEKDEFIRNRMVKSGDKYIMKPQSNTGGEVPPTAEEIIKKLKSVMGYVLDQLGDKQIVECHVPVFLIKQIKDYQFQSSQANEGKLSKEPVEFLEWALQEGYEFYEDAIYYRGHEEMFMTVDDLYKQYANQFKEQIKK